MKRRASGWTLALMLTLGVVGCQSGQREAAERAYYEHRYPTARQHLRPHAADRDSNNVVLDNMRLGLTAMADGGYDEAERSLLRAYEYLISGRVNAPDRAVTSQLIYEGTRVWKGEPYEQAMSFYYLAALYMLQQDWENARAAASNALFQLRDFGGGEGEPKSMGRIVREAEARGDESLEESYSKVKSEFALGYLLAATNHVLMGRPEDGRRLFERVRTMRPELTPLADRLASGGFDTLLLIDQGRGPRKQPYGPDGALVRYVPDGRKRATPTVAVAVDGRSIDAVGARPVVDLWTLSQFPKWWSLEPMREARSAIGRGLVAGGLVATGYGVNRGSKEAMIGGVAAMLAGAAMRASAQADTRHLEMLPRCVFMVPLRLGPGEHDVRVRFNGDSGAGATWHDLAAGREGEPEVYYLRMHDGNGRGMPPWSDRLQYSTRVEQYRDGDRPWIMGGRDLTPPGPELMRAYHASGVLSDHSLGELEELYRAEGIVMEPGPQGRNDAAAENPDLYRHVAEGGRALHRPRPGSHLYQRVTRLEHRSYEARSDALRRIIDRWKKEAQPSEPPGPEEPKDPVAHRDDGNGPAKGADRD